MTAAEKKELEAVDRELQRIVQQLDGLSTQLRSGFAGIGSEYCAKAVELAAGKCRLVQKGLRGLKNAAGA